MSALLGYGIGMILSLLVIWATKDTTLLIIMTPGLALLLFALTHRHVHHRRDKRDLQGDAHRSRRSVQPMKDREPNRKTLLEAKNIVKVFGSGADEVRPLEGRRPQALRR